MQDTDTGEMVPLDMKIAENDLQTAKDMAIPERKRQGVVLRVGQKVELNGGLFCVESIGRKSVQLRGLPGTNVINENTLTAATQKRGRDGK